MRYKGTLSIAKSFFAFTSSNFYSLLSLTHFILFLFLKVSFKMFIFKHYAFYMIFQISKILSVYICCLLFLWNLNNDGWSHCVFGAIWWWDHVYLITISGNLGGQNWDSSLQRGFEIVPKAARCSSRLRSLPASLAQCRCLRVSHAYSQLHS